MWDSDYIFRECDRQQNALRTLDSWIPACVPGWSYISDIVMSRTEKRIVYCLTSLIEAHEYAQQKIHFMMGLSIDRKDLRNQSSEFANDYLAVIEESKSWVI